MTIAEMQTYLSGILGFEGKVAYRSFPEQAAVPLPFIVFIDTAPVEFFADNVNYYTLPTYQVELYEKYRDPSLELLIEAKLMALGITFTREVGYLDTEKCWMVAYSFTTKEAN